MTEKLGPCPLCGGEMGQSHDEDGMCLSLYCNKCGLVVLNGETWSRLSALAASERRLREALERCRETVFWNAFKIDVLAVINEALKGGK